MTMTIKALKHPIKYLRLVTTPTCVKEETIDLCDECLEMAVVIEAAGCMGRNSYRFVR